MEVSSPYLRSIFAGLKIRDIYVGMILLLTVAWSTTLISWDNPKLYGSAEKYQMNLLTQKISILEHQIENMR